MQQYLITLIVKLLKLVVALAATLSVEIRHRKAKV